MTVATLRGRDVALKNAIDIGSRPYGKSVWSRKPCNARLSRSMPRPSHSPPELADDIERLGDRMVAVARLHCMLHAAVQMVLEQPQREASSADCTALICVRTSMQ